MPPKPKTEEERLKLRQLILDAARELFVARGVDAVTMREIARIIGYSATAIYLHFKDKDEIIRAICDTDFLALASELKQSLQITDPVERIVAMGYGYARFALSHPNQYRMMFMTQRPASDPEVSEVQQGNPEQDAYTQLKQAVLEIFNQQLFRTELTDPNLIAQTIWAALHGVCSLEIFFVAHDNWVNWCDIEARLHLMQQTLINGLLRAPAP
ncbi:MAG: TetR/AcrR family transcriptional regulator [Methylophilaceae bacterium]